MLPDTARSPVCPFLQNRVLSVDGHTIVGDAQHLNILGSYTEIQLIVFCLLVLLINRKKWLKDRNKYFTLKEVVNLHTQNKAGFPPCWQSRGQLWWYQRIYMRRRQMQPHVSLRKSSVNPWRKPLVRKQCVFCFAVVCLVFFPNRKWVNGKPHDTW